MAEMQDPWPINEKVFLEKALYRQMRTILAWIIVPLVLIVMIILALLLGGLLLLLMAGLWLVWQSVQLWRRMRRRPPKQKFSQPGGRIIDVSAHEAHDRS